MQKLRKAIRDRAARGQVLVRVHAWALKRYLKERRAGDWRVARTEAWRERYERTGDPRDLAKFRESRTKLRQQREKLAKLQHSLRVAAKDVRSSRVKLRMWRRKYRIAQAKASQDHQWGGSRAITNEVIRIVGARAPVTSRKRVATFGNPDSDHHVSQRNADAVDFGITNAHWLADVIAHRLGGPNNVDDYEHFHIRRNGRLYRVQIIAGTHGTGPHLHVGVRRV